MLQATIGIAVSQVAVLEYLPSLEGSQIAESSVLKGGHFMYRNLEGDKSLIVLYIYIFSRICNYRHPLSLWVVLSSFNIESHLSFLPSVLQHSTLLLGGSIQWHLFRGGKKIKNVVEQSFSKLHCDLNYLFPFYVKNVIFTHLKGSFMSISIRHWSFRFKGVQHTVVYV